MLRTSTSANSRSNARQPGLLRRCSLVAWRLGARRPPAPRPTGSGIAGHCPTVPNSAWQWVTVSGAGALRRSAGTEYTSRVRDV